VIVVDTNIISYLLVRNDTYTADAKELFRKDSAWVSPALWKFEFFNLINLYRKRNLMSENAMRDIFFKSLETVETVDLVDLTFLYNVATASDLTGYDAQFVALASEMNLPLITEDKRILSEFGNTSISIKNFLNE